MKKLFKYIFCLFLILNFSGCWWWSSQTQDDMKDTRKDDEAQLIRAIIEKDKKINDLNKKLEDSEAQNESQKTTP